MDLAEYIGLDDQRRGSGSRFAPGVEPGEGALVAGRGEQFPRTLAANAERAALATVAAADDMAKLGEHAFMQPAQQRRALLGRLGAGIRAQCIGISCQRAAHFGPIGDGGANIRQRRFQRGTQAHAAARIGAAGFDVDYRFALTARAFDYGRQQPVRVALNADNRMQQPVDCQSLRGNRRCQRVDDEGRVLTYHGNPHQSLANHAWHGLDGNRGSAGIALRRSIADEACGSGQCLRREWRVAGQQRCRQMPRQCCNEAVWLALAHRSTLSLFQRGVKTLG